MRALKHGVMTAALCGLLMAGLGSSSAQAGTVAQGKAGKEVEMAPVDDQPIYLATFNTGVKTSDVYTEGQLSFVLPVWSTLGSDGFLGGGVVYLEPYTSLGESGELATSLGLGWRYLFNDQPVSTLKAGANAPGGFLSEGVYVGANVFVDNLRTQFDNDFWQLGVGVEVGSRYVEVRGNYYLPFDSSPKLAERTTSTQKFTSRSTRTSTRSEVSSSAGSNGGEPFAVGNTIQQDVGLTNTAITTTRTTTTTTTVKTITSLFEEGMEGWDVEAAFLVPGLDKYLDVTLLAGYYSFDNQPFGPQRGGSGNTEGFKAGIEIRPVPALVLTGMWYEDEGLTGSDWVAGIGLQIPLSKDWKEAFKPRRRHLIERLGEPVGRQNAAIKTARSVDVDRDVSTQSRTHTAVRRTVTQRQGRITIAEDIVFVNNGDAVGNGIAAGSATGDGTAESPYDTIQAGADAAGTNNANTQRVWTVYTQNQGITYGDSVAISGSTRFTSSYVPIVSQATGQVFGGDTARPVVFGGFAADSSLFLENATTPSLVEVSGYEIQLGYGVLPSQSVNIPGGVTEVGAMAVGIFMANVDGVIVRYNKMKGMLNGILVGNAGAPQTVTITDNEVNESINNGILVNTMGGIQQGEISRNTVTDSGTGGLYMLISEGGFSGVINDNTMTGNVQSGIYVAVQNGGFNGDINGNDVSDNGLAGIEVITASDFNGDISNNEVGGNGENGIDVKINDSDFTGNISGNTGSSIGRTGLSMRAENIYGNISGNIFSLTGNQGIAVQAYDSFTGNLIGNKVSYSFRDGITLATAGDFTGNITDNEATYNGSETDGHGFVITAQGEFDGTASGNRSDFNGGNGFYTGAGTISAGAVSGPNSATGNALGNFQPISGSPIISEFP